MNPFKRGDFAKCINPTYTKLVEGQLYPIDDVDGDLIHTRLINHLGSEVLLTYHCSRFAKALTQIEEKQEMPVQSNMRVSETGGLRDNKNKARHSLVPTSLVVAVAQVLHSSSVDGGGKYPLYNWKKGLPWTEVADSALRHIRDFLDGKDYDKESQLHTLWHAATNLAFLIEYIETCPQLDDRFKGHK